MDERERAQRNAWTEYAGYQIKPCREPGREHLFVLCKDGCNAAPAAQFFDTVDLAIAGACLLEVVDGDGSKWNFLWRAIREIAKSEGQKTARR